MADRRGQTPRPTTPLCPTTPGGIPIRLLVDAEPRSRARRALALLVVLAAGIAAVALAGCGAPSGAGAWRVSWWDDVTSERIASDPVEVGSGGAVLRVPPFACHVAALIERAE